MLYAAPITDLITLTVAGNIINQGDIHYVIFSTFMLLSLTIFKYDYNSLVSNLNIIFYFNINVIILQIKFMKFRNPIADYLRELPMIF
jgi:hypothetical protein